MKKFLCKLLFLIYAPLQTFFFFEMQTNFFTHCVCKQFFFVFEGPANNFFQYFSYSPPPSRKIMVRPLFPAKFRKGIFMALAWYMLHFLVVYHGYPTCHLYFLGIHHLKACVYTEKIQVTRGSISLESVA